MEAEATAPGAIRPEPEKADSGDDRARTALPLPLRFSEAFRLGWILAGLLHRDLRQRLAGVKELLVSYHVGAFSHLDCMDATAKTDLLPAIGARMDRLGWSFTIEDLLKDVWGKAILPVVVGPVILGLFISRLRTSLSIYDVSIYHVSLAELLTALPVVVRLATLVAQTLPLLLVLVFFFLWPFRLTLAAMIIIAAVSGWWALASLGKNSSYILTATLITVTACVASRMILYLGLALVRSVQARRFPYETILDQLINALVATERASMGWSTIRTRRYALGRLEDVARSIESNLPRRLRSGDSQTDQWLRDTCGLMAVDIRRLKRDIAFPGLASGEAVTATLSRWVQAVAAGRWLDVPLAEPKAVTAASRLLRAAGRAGRVAKQAGRLLLGGIPLAAFAAWQATPWVPHLPGGLANTVWGVTILWAVLSLASLDPRFDEKVDVLSKL